MQRNDRAQRHLDNSTNNFENFYTDILTTKPNETVLTKKKMRNHRQSLTVLHKE